MSQRRPPSGGHDGQAGSNEVRWSHARRQEGDHPVQASRLID
jgi:hypothetical protein